MKRKGRKFDWSDEEIAFLKENYGKLSLEDMGMRLGISFTTVRNKAVEIGLEYKRVDNRITWSSDMIDYLCNHYVCDTLSDIASHIGLSQPTIQRKAKELGLKRPVGYDRNAFRSRYVNGYSNHVGVK